MFPPLLAAEGRRKEDVKFLKAVVDPRRILPEGAKWHHERKAALEAGLIEHVSITLDRETINCFKSQTGVDGPIGGTKWMVLVEKTLQEHARQEQKA